MYINHKRCRIFHVSGNTHTSQISFIHTWKPTTSLLTIYQVYILWHWHFFREPVAMCWLWQSEGLQSTAGSHHVLATGVWLEQGLGWQRHHLLWLILQKPSDSAAFPQVYSGMVSLRRWSSWSGMFIGRPRLALTLKGYGFYFLPVHAIYER